jgi:peptidoglycan/LPS O-acetylase OafA/YrhL
MLGPLVRMFDLPRWASRGLPNRILLMSLLTIAVAWVSWQVMEQPIQRWKRFFPYRRKKADLVPAADVERPLRRAA